MACKNNQENKKYFYENTISCILSHLKDEEDLNLEIFLFHLISDNSYLLENTDLTKKLIEAMVEKIHTLDTYDLRKAKLVSTLGAMGKLEGEVIKAN